MLIVYYSEIIIWMLGFIFLQVGTALRPAFADDVPPDVTAMACEVRNYVMWLFNRLKGILHQKYATKSF